MRRVRIVLLTSLLVTGMLADIALAHVGGLRESFEIVAGAYDLAVMVTDLRPGSDQVSVVVRVERGNASQLEVQDALTSQIVSADALCASRPSFFATLPTRRTALRTINIRVSGSDGYGVGSLTLEPEEEGPRTWAERLVCWLTLACAGTVLLQGVFAAARWRSAPHGVHLREANISSSVLGLVLGVSWSVGLGAETVSRARKAPSLSSRERGGRILLDFRDLGRDLTIAKNHGKWLHVLLLSEGAGDTLAHLHPQKLGRESFDAALPPLPAGRYIVFAELLTEAGSIVTLRDELRLTTHAEHQESGDADDVWYNGAAPRPSSPCDLVLNAPTNARAGERIMLRFRLKDTLLRAPLELYMGMLAHVFIFDRAGQTFAHLHAQPVTHIRLPHVSTEQSKLPTTPSLLEVPFVATQSGRHQIFVQVRCAGEVRTSAFTLDLSGR